MTEARPSVVILAGPNGAGKSTAAPALLQGALAVTTFVNADVIARGPDRLESQPVRVYDEGNWRTAQQSKNA